MRTTGIVGVHVWGQPCEVEALGELATRIQLMHNFGFAGLDNVIHIGTNGKMSEVSAIMGLSGLESLDESVAVNYRNYGHYRRQLIGVPGMRMLAYDENEQGNYQCIVLEIDAADAGIQRDQLVDILHAEGIRARRSLYPGCHRMEPYRSHIPHAGLLLPETERLAERVMTLPTGTSIGLEDVARICQVIQFATTHGQESSAKLAGERT